MRSKRKLRLMTVISLGLSLALVLPVLAADAPRIEKEKLKDMLGKPELMLIDVRAGADWKASTQKIKGAVREDPDQVDTWMKKYPKDKTMVFYCA
jgi:rhodanese-related sulfurtransferase